MNLTLALTPAEKDVLLDFLHQLSDYFCNAGCNDFSMPNDEQHRELMRSVIKSRFAPKDQPEQLNWLEQQTGKRINTTDSLVLGHLIALINAMQPTRAI